ncbi:MAG: hypothetical protein R2809_00025 [Flavobacteriales bacterium]
MRSLDSPIRKRESLFQAFYHTGITVNDWYNFGTDIVGKIDLSNAVPEKSSTMVTYEGFKRLGFGESVSDELFTELVNILGQSKEKSHRDKEISIKSFVK